MATSSRSEDYGTALRGRAMAATMPVGRDRAPRAPSPESREFGAEYAISRLIERIFTFISLAALLAAFAYSLATGFWLGVAAILGGALLCAVLLYDSRLMVVGWIVSVPTICVIANNYVKVIPVVTVDRLFFAIVLGLFFLGLIFDKTRRRGLLSVEKAILLFLTVCLASLIAHSFDRSQQTIIRDVALYIQGLFLPMMSLLIARQVRWDERGLQLLMVGLIGCGVLLGLFGFLQFLFKMSFFVPNYMEVVQNFDHHSGEARRTTGPFANAVEYGCVLGIFSVITLFWFLRARDPFIRGGLLAIMGFMLLALLISRARAAWLGTLIAFGFVFLLDKRSRPFLSVMALAGGFALALALPFIVQSGAFQAISNRAMEWSPIYNRIALSSTALNMFINNPIFGLGFGRSTFFEAKRLYLTSIGDVSAQFAGGGLSVPHNEFLHIMLMTGLTGIIPYILVLVHCFRLLKRSRQSVDEATWFAREFHPYLAGIFAVFLINAMSADIMWFSYLTTLHFFLFGVLASSLAQGRPTDAAVPVPAEPRRR